jgi:hypothetical protein
MLVLVYLTHDRCTVCGGHSIGSEVDLHALVGSPR